MPRLPLILPDAAPPPKVPIIRDPRGRRQPVAGARINWANPITRGLKVAVSPVFGFVNAASGKALAYYSGGPLGVSPTQARSGPAIGWKFSIGSPIAVDTGWSYPSGGTTEDYSMSAFVLYKNDGFSSGNQWVFGNRFLSNAGVALVLEDSGGIYPNEIGRMQWVHGNIATYLQTSGSIVGSNVRAVPLGISTTERSDVKFFTDGKLTNTAGVNFVSNTSVNIHFGMQTFTADKSEINGVLPLLLLWSRELSAAEHMSLAIDPWQVCV